MQAIRNKLHGKSKRRSLEEKMDHHERTETVTTTSTSSDANNLPQESISKTTTVTDTFVDSSIPTPPPLPASDFWLNGPTRDYWNESSFNSDYNSPSGMEFTTRTTEILPTEFIEKPVIIHENIRKEQVEEIQPIVRVEHEKTEIRQITQPLMDKEIKPVVIEERTLPLEVLPTVTRDAIGIPEVLETSTRSFESTVRQIVEKKPIVQETEKWRIIEEIQPIIYRETIIPHVIRTSRPMREVIVEAPVFTQQTLSSRELSSFERERYARFFEQDTIVREVLPSQSFKSVPEIIPIHQNAVPEHHHKEIIKDVTTTTTTTTVAPTIGSVLPSNLSSSKSTNPIVVDESHKTKFGPKGERITTDSVTTQSILPTRVN